MQRRRLTVLLVGAAIAALVSAMAGAAVAQDTGCKGDIVLDPGHGGGDMGAINRTYSLTEKAENLDVAKRLKALLETDGYTVCMTRTDDRALSNNDRYTYANSTGAKILVSIHMNGSSNSDTDYTTTLFGKWQKDKQLALVVHGELTKLPAAKANDPDGYLDGRTPYSYASGVLLKSNMPATIAETVFITNNKEAEWLATGRVPAGAGLPAGTQVSRQQQIARALQAGIKTYLPLASSPPDSGSDEPDGGGHPRGGSPGKK